MLPMNRIYTAQELRAMSRLTPVELRTPVPAARKAGGSTGSGAGGRLAARLRRICARAVVRRSAPGTI
jgi:hypothetical protein